MSTVFADYINSDNDIISYLQGLIENGFSIDGEDYTMRGISINGVEGQIYEYNKKDITIPKTYIIIWNDSEYYYRLIGAIEIEELLKMAESLEKQE